MAIVDKRMESCLKPRFFNRKTQSLFDIEFFADQLKVVAQLFINCHVIAYFLDAVHNCGMILLAQK